MSQAKDSDSDDWFDKDENELLKNLKVAQKAEKEEDESTEYVSIGARALEELRNQGPGSEQYGPSAPKITMGDFRKMAQMVPLDAFLYASAHNFDFFVGQVSRNDSQERVLLYAHILASFCDLEFPGFHSDLLRCFAANEELFEHFKMIAGKLFSKRYKSQWLDEKNVDEIVKDMQRILLQTHHSGVQMAPCVQLMQHIQELLSACDNPTVAKRPTCVELLAHLERILKAEQEPHAGKPRIADEIYPSLEEFKAAMSDVQHINCVLNDHSSIVKHDYKSVDDYILIQKQLLREDFMIPLRESIKSIKETNTLRSRPQRTLHDDVCIVLNEQFLNAQRHEMLFVDVMGSRRDAKSKISPKVFLELSHLKTGALLCFTTSTDFENLILATISFTDTDLLREGYIGVEIVRQYNIGNIYDRQLLMFETPAFLEPYRNVYNFLSTCNTADFPMRDYIVFGQADTKPPEYLTSDSTYKYEGSTFKPLQDAPPEGLPLNASQLSAYRDALTSSFALIQGPPGTGKTHLSVQLMRMLIENANTPIILITYTNDSLDKFLIKLSPYTDSIVRFGTQTRSREIAKYNIRSTVDKNVLNPNLKRLYYATDLKFKEEFQKLQVLHKEFDGTDDSYQLIVAAQSAVSVFARKLQSIRIMFQYYEVREKAVVAMTTTCASRMSFLFRLLKSSVVLFEEAAEILESHVVACLTPYTQHVIMIGDHMQLQPYTSSYQHSRSYEMNVSLFERLIKRQLKHSVLDLQYRMRPAIAELVAPIYKKLRNHDVVARYPNVRKMKKNQYFFTHEQRETKPEYETSVHNKYEMDEIIKLAQYLVEVSGYTVEDIVILSPYAKQIQQIQNKLKKIPLLENLRANSVDSFQGLEANIVLLTLVRNNTTAEIGFLAEVNRICVALSRAKHGLYIIGNLKLLEECSSTWADIGKKLRTRQSVGDSFPYECVV